MPIKNKLCELLMKKPLVTLVIGYVILVVLCKLFFGVTGFLLGMIIIPLIFIIIIYILT